MTRDEIMVLIRASEQRHYVYLLSRPDGQPFYVGVGTGRRILDHAIFARRAGLDSHKLREIRKLWRLGLDIEYAILCWFETREDAQLFEASEITRIGRRDIRTGPLANVTAGGEGAPSPSDEIIDRRSRSLREAWAKRDNKVAAMAHLHNPEIRAKAALARKGKARGSYIWTKSPGPRPAARIRASERLKADPLSRRPGVAQKIAAAHRGRSIPDHHMKRSEYRKRFSGRGNPAASPLIVDSKTFGTRDEAAAHFGVCRSTIDYWLRRGLRGTHRPGK